MNKKTLLIYLLLLFQLNVAYALIGIASIKYPQCGSDAGGEVGFFVNGTAGPFDYCLIEKATGNKIKCDFNVNSPDIIIVSDLKQGDYTIEVTTQLNPNCRKVREFSIKCCEADVPALDVVLEDKGIDPNSLQGHIYIRVIPDDAGPFYYHWTGPTGKHYITQNIDELLEEGEYCVTVTNGCASGTACFELTKCEDTDKISITGVVMPEKSTGDQTGMIDISIVGTAPFDVKWYDEQGTLIIEYFGVSDGDIDKLTSGKYKVMVSDGQNCKIAYFTVYSCEMGIAGITPQATLIKPIPSFASNGSITLDLAASNGKGVSYYWITQPPATTKDIFNLSGSVYCVNIKDELCGTDFNECYDLGASCNLTINAKIKPECKQDGSIEVFPLGSKKPTFTYVWSNNGSNTNILNNLQAGKYSVTVSDLAGCAVTEQFTVPDRAIILQNPNAECTETNSVITIEASTFGDPACNTCMFTWSDGFVGRTRSKMLPGAYTVTVKNNACQKIKIVNVYDLNATISKVCNLQSGSISLPPVIGVNYWWSNAGVFISSNNVINALNAGTYTVSLTNTNNSCTTTKQFVLENNEIILKNPDTECALTTSTVNIEASTLSDPTCSNCIFTWIDGYIGKTRSNIPAGIYSVVIKNSAGCEKIKTINVNDLEATVYNPICAANKSSISLASSPLVSYGWSSNNGFSSSNSTITALNPGIYTRCSSF